VVFYARKVRFVGIFDVKIAMERGGVRGYVFYSSRGEEMTYAWPPSGKVELLVKSLYT
jgi:hypothetical protein